METPETVTEEPIIQPEGSAGTEANQEIESTNTNQEVVVDYSSILKEKTQGRFSSFDEIDTIVKDYETIKAQPKHEYANDLSRKLDEYVRKNGESADIESFLKIQKIDTTKLSDIELARIYYKDIDKLNLTSEELDEYIISKYAIDPDGEIGFSKLEKINGKINFDKDSKLMRSEIENWKAKIESSPTSVETKAPSQEDILIYEQNQRKVKQEAVDYFTELKTTIGEIPSEIKDKVLVGLSDLSGNAFWGNFQTADNKFDQKKYYKAFLYASNPELIEKQISDIAYKKGVESVLNGAKNPNLTQSSTSTVGTKLTVEEIARINYERNK